MNDDEKPFCHDGEGFYQCIGGTVYGPCEAENCGGICEPIRECDCQGCDFTRCCKKEAP